MSITDELMTEIGEYPFREPQDFRKFYVIAYRINVEHEKAINAAYETCRNEEETDPDTWFVCSECGFGSHEVERKHNFCPNCGRRIVG